MTEHAGHRVAAGFITLLALLAAVLVYGSVQLRGIGRAFDAVVNVALPAERQAQAMAAAAQQRITLMLRMLAEPDPFEREGDARAFEAQGLVFGRARDAFGKLPLDAAARERLDEVLDAALRLSQTQREAVAALLGGQDGQARALVNGQQAFEQQRALHDRLRALQGHMQGEATRLQRAAMAEQGRAQVLLMGVGGGALVFGVALGFWVTRNARRAEAALQAGRARAEAEGERLAALLRALPVGVTQLDARGRTTDANPEACRMLEQSVEQLQGREPADPRWQLLREDGTPLPDEEQPATRALRSGQPVRGVALGVALPAGQRRWLRANAEPLRGPGGDVVGAVSSFADITAYLSQRRLLELTIGAAELGTWDWQLGSDRFEANARCFEMLGWRPGQWPPEHAAWKALVYPQDLPVSLQALQRHLDGELPLYSCELRLRRADGGWAWVLASGAVIERDEQGAPLRMVGVRMDISQRKALEQRLADAALTDALTGLPNRGALHARLAQCAARAQRDPQHRYALLFMDFDRFKQVNDSLGHAAGDELLRQIAERLRTTLRPGDDLARLEADEHTAARLGGDEFVALLEPLRRTEDATAVAQRLLDALAAPYLIAGQ